MSATIKQNIKFQVHYRYKQHKRRDGQKEKLSIEELKNCEKIADRLYKQLMNNIDKRVERLHNASKS